MSCCWKLLKASLASISGEHLWFIRLLCRLIGWSWALSWFAYEMETTLARSLAGRSSWQRGGDVTSGPQWRHCGPIHHRRPVSQWAPFIFSSFHLICIFLADVDFHRPIQCWFMQMKISSFAYHWRVIDNLTISRAMRISVTQIYANLCQCMPIYANELLANGVPNRKLNRVHFWISIQLNSFNSIQFRLESAPFPQLLPVMEAAAAAAAAAALPNISNFFLNVDDFIFWNILLSITSADNTAANVTRDDNL